MADILVSSLELAWETAVDIGGPDSSLWKWGAFHRTDAKHTLTPLVGERLNPPNAGMGGDGDTVQVSSVGSNDIGVDPIFPVGALSVYRQVVDFNDASEGWWIIPGGASGDYESSHYFDQLRLWETHQLIPMLFQPSRVRDEATSTQIIQR